MRSSEGGILRATSIAHQHIAAVINTLLAPATDAIRVLDLGCGNGRLLAHMLDALAVLRPGVHVEAYGLDVWDAGQQPAGYMEETRRYLARTHPEADWDTRLVILSAKDRWPYPEGGFDFITSNHVMEHVHDRGLLFREIRRCLRPGGVSVNLFPLRSTLWEGHALMPFVHRIRDERQRRRLMWLLASVGFRRHYHREKVKRGWTTLEEYARDFAHVLETDTDYLTASQLAEQAERAALSLSLTFTKDFFLAKALSFAGRRPYRYLDVGFLEHLGFLLGRYLSSVTVLLRRRTVAGGD